MGQKIYKKSTENLSHGAHPWDPNHLILIANWINVISRGKGIMCHYLSRVNYDETYMWKLVKVAGGKWNSSKKVWEIPYGEILDLGLEDRIVKEWAKND